MRTLLRASALVAAWVVTAVAADPRRESTAPERVVIDATAVGARISPLIYGQFIEHLGRCVQGGLWAEMLEDRKFFYPVTGEAPAWEMYTPGSTSWEGEGHPYELLVRSPWLIVGDKRAVRMVREGALAGEHSVELSPNGSGSGGASAPSGAGISGAASHAYADSGAVGLRQERLTVRAGRAYVGRIVLAGAPTARVEVSLAWGGGSGARQTILLEGLGAGWSTRSFTFDVATDAAEGGTDNGRLEIVARGVGAVRVGAVSLMPADNRSGWRADTLARLRELDAPVYRWPGGNFVSGYDWRDGIGDRDRRPPRKNPAWKGVEANDVGLHEFMELCALVGAEPYVAVNSGLGDVASAAALVAYANGSVTTPMGGLRARNGHAAPFGVRLWAVGNEMYGDWQAGHMPLEAYVEKHRLMAAAMRAVDPAVQLVAVGSVGPWSRTMLSGAAADMSHISEHIYWQGKDDVAAHVAQVPAGIRAIAEAHRSYRRELPGLTPRDVRIALDEWNYWYGPFEYGELGTRYFLKDALGIAAGLHELARQSDLFVMANYAQTVNVLGAIKTTGGAAELEPTGLALALYRRHFGSLPVAVRSVAAALDVAAAWTEDRAALTVAFVNAESRARRVRLEITGARLARAGGSRFVLTGATALSGNVPGQPRAADVVESAAPDPSAALELSPLSVTLFRWAVAKKTAGARAGANTAASPSPPR